MVKKPYNPFPIIFWARKRIIGSGYFSVNMKLIINFTKFTFSGARSAKTGIRTANLMVLRVFPFSNQYTNDTLNM